MVTYSKSANGTFSGKVGSIIGSNWPSIDYLKGLPKKSSKSISGLVSRISCRNAFCPYRNPESTFAERVFWISIDKLLINQCFLS
jgi:hypothetical protein